MATPYARCECVIWRQPCRRCELWVIGGVTRLRVFEHERMVHEEPFVAGRGWDRAVALRTAQVFAEEDAGVR